jgi:hypothetical protein
MGSKEWKWKYGKYKMVANKKSKRLPSATVRGQYQTIGTTFDPS